MTSSRLHSAAPRTLRYSLSPLNAQHTRWAFIGYAVLTLWTAVALAWMMFPEFTDADRADFWPALGNEIAEQPASLVYWAGMAAVFGLVVFLFRTRSTARLHLTNTGIEASLPNWMGLFGQRQTAGDWQIGWHEITAATATHHDAGPSRLSTNTPVMLKSRVILETARGDFWVNAFAWHDPGDDHRLSLGELAFQRNFDIENRLASTPVYRALEARGIGVERAGQADLKMERPAPDGFDLSAHRGIKALLALFALALGYLVIDQFIVGRFQPLESLPLWPFAAAAMAGLPVVVLLSRGAPPTERAAIGGLVVVTLVAAAWPGTLRFNAMTAEKTRTTYSALEFGLFEPADPEIPIIDLRDAGLDEYWEQFPPGASHSFVLLKGDAGFWQLDPTPLYTRTREFYRGR